MSGRKQWIATLVVGCLFNGAVSASELGTDEEATQVVAAPGTVAALAALEVPVPVPVHDGAVARLADSTPLPGDGTVASQPPPSTSILYLIGVSLIGFALVARRRTTRPVKAGELNTATV